MNKQRRTDHQEQLPQVVRVRYKDGTEGDALVTATTQRFPRLCLRDGGTVEVARETLLTCHQNNRPVII